MDQVAVVVGGGDPLGVLRDPSENALIVLQNEEGPAKSARFMLNHANRYSPIFEDAKALSSDIKRPRCFRSSPAGDEGPQLLPVASQWRQTCFLY